MKHAWLVWCLCILYNYLTLDCCDAQDACSTGTLYGIVASVQNKQNITGIMPLFCRASDNFETDPRITDCPC